MEDLQPFGVEAFTEAVDPAPEIGPDVPSDSG